MNLLLAPAVNPWHCYHWFTVNAAQQWEVPLYGKLYSSMFDGSLATRGPWEAIVTFQQFIALCDREGYLDMTADAIARRTTIPIKIIQAGIDALTKPDPDSRSPAEDGRRLVLINPARPWGWRVVNYAKYRAIRSAEERREYMRQYQQQRRQAKEKGNGTAPASALPDGFESFWTAYPRKVGKAAAARAWKRLDPNVELRAVIDRALSAQAAAWTDPQYIPHAATWLNGRRWEDAPPELQAKQQINAKCYYCPEPAVKLTNDIPHCKRADHLDFAVARRT